MAWSDTWTDILSGGSPRWKVDDLNAKKIALDYITQHHTATNSTTTDDDQQKEQSNTPPLRILCPLAGDDPFIQYAYSLGHEVTAIDIVPEALEVMRLQFGDANDWSVVETCSSNKGEKQWKHTSGKVTLYEGDILTKRSELFNSFDAIYDKDSFGALNLDMRRAYCKRLSEYIKPNGTVYIEVKYKENEWQRPNGPPYHVEKEDIMNEESFGSGCFEYVKNLGEVYPLSIPNMKQTGHILRRVLKR